MKKEWPIEEFINIKEARMPARTTRAEARKRVIQAFMTSLERIIPEDESKPLKGSRFLDWELQAQALKQAVVPTLLEERAALEDNALVEAKAPGHCPHCGSSHVYLEKETTRAELISPDGSAEIEKQHCRCRQCGGSFSPSAS
ncbi:MAG: hypothetical protein ABSA30_14115 [Candidatus Aminicenantales bacterium]